MIANTQHASGKALRYGFAAASGLTVGAAAAAVSVLFLAVATL